MSPAIANARNYQKTLRNGIPTAEENRARLEAAILIEEVKIIAGHIDRLLLDTPLHHVSSCEIWGVQVRLVRFSGVSYRLISDNGKGGFVWTSITELANEAAEWALGQGFLKPAYLQ